MYSAQMISFVLPSSFLFHHHFFISCLFHKHICFSSIFCPSFHNPVLSFILCCLELPLPFLPYLFFLSFSSFSHLCLFSHPFFFLPLPSTFPMPFQVYIPFIFDYVLHNLYTAFACIQKLLCLLWLCVHFFFGWPPCIGQPIRGFTSGRCKFSFSYQSAIDNKFMFQGWKTVKTFPFYINMSNNSNIFVQMLIGEAVSHKTFWLFCTTHLSFNCIKLYVVKANFLYLTDVKLKLKQKIRKKGKNNLNSIWQ